MSMFDDPGDRLSAADTAAGAALRTIISLCPHCREVVMDPEWIKDPNTTGEEMVAEMGAHLMKEHPDKLDVFLKIGENLGCIEPPIDGAPTGDSA